MAETGQIRSATEASGAAPDTVHPLYVRITHWINALAILIMIGSGWQIYNASPLFAFTFPKASRSAAGWPAACSGISRPCGSDRQRARLRDGRGS
jgi:hypothetical protein